MVRSSAASMTLLSAMALQHASLVVAQTALNPTVTETVDFSCSAMFQFLGDWENYFNQIAGLCHSPLSTNNFCSSSGGNAIGATQSSDLLGLTITDKLLQRQTTAPQTLKYENVQFGPFHNLIVSWQTTITLNTVDSSTCRITISGAGQFTADASMVTPLYDLSTETNALSFFRSHYRRYIQHAVELAAATGVTNTVGITAKGATELNVADISNCLVGGAVTLVSNGFFEDIINLIGLTSTQSFSILSCTPTSNGGTVRLASSVILARASITVVIFNVVVNQGGSSCFASESSVSVAGRNEPMPLKQLQRGDKVMVRPCLEASCFEDVIGFLHSEGMPSSLLTIEHTGGAMRVTDNHILFVQQGFTSASSLLGTSARETSSSTRMVGRVQYFPCAEM
eukprot:TRINITY_DN17076_c0_g2_i1.p1 TRINITY_DN17076_c0_g2~~TRINITY_DN17076_c0_g2_i1.p1  ORF type:complete len:397 (+),score=59.25 TRINITY_DN17076_c0_g2_i1:68-1258(+)